ncbi:hypothetical protein Tco_0637723 [Tanacetum coccineum]
MEYDSRVNERLMQTIEEKVDSSKALDARQQHTERLEFNNETEVDQNAEQCHDIRPLPAKLTDNMTTELSDQSLEVDVLAQIQKKGFAIAALKNELRKLTGNSVNTKFAKPSILGKPVLQPHRNQSVVRQPTAFKSERPKISKPWFASQVDVNNDLWVPTGKTFASSTTKVDSEPPNGSNADITNQCESEQALDVSVDISENRASRNFDLMINMMTFKQRSSSLGRQCQMASAENNTSGPASFFIKMTSDQKPFRNSDSRHTAMNCQVHSGFQKVVRLGINPMIQPEPEDLPKDNPNLEIAVLRVILFSIHNDEWKSFQCHHQTALRMSMLVKDTRSQDGIDDKDNDKGSKSRSQSMKEQAYNKEQRERPRPHELNDKSNLIDLMKECGLPGGELPGGEFPGGELPGGELPGGGLPKQVAV